VNRYWIGPVLRLQTLYTQGHSSERTCHFKFEFNRYGTSKSPVHDESQEQD